MFRNLLKFVTLFYSFCICFLLLLFYLGELFFLFFDSLFSKFVLFVFVWTKFDIVCMYIYNNIELYKSRKIIKIHVCFELKQHIVCPFA